MTAPSVRTRVPRREERLPDSAFIAAFNRRSILWPGTAALSVFALGATLLWPPRPFLLWNASPSSPIGLYVVKAPGSPRVGEIVVAFAPERARRLAAARFYLPFAVPLVKRVAATSGDRVCGKGASILVNGRVAALRRKRDPSGRSMPSWSGCRLLGLGELLLLSPRSAEAFDGRYFGITKAADVIGRARLLWPG